MTEALQVWILDEPWALLTGGSLRRSIGRSVEQGETVFDISGTGSPSIAVPAEVKRVYGGGKRRGLLPTLSTNFTWNQDRLRHYALPACNKESAEDYVDDKITISFDYKNKNYKFHLIQKNGISRAQNIKEEEDTTRRPYVLKDFIDWQIGCIQELIDPTFLSDPQMDSTTDGIIHRRTWKACRGAWLKKDLLGESDPARMALIVSLAQSKDTLHTLEMLCRSPRAILQRFRQRTRLNLVEELDAACLRYYARQPGKNSVEKAGPTQTLLSVKRRPNYDTLENRILRWVIERCDKLAARYLAQNRRYINESQRCADVKRLKRTLSMAFMNSPIQFVSTSLPSPVQPNYQLQQNPKYRKLWRVYKRLLAEQRIEEDSWDWQRILWKESCQLILYACLTDEESPLDEELGLSSVYLREESVNGIWVETPACPGPFRVNNLNVHILSPKDLPSREDNIEDFVPEGWAPWLGKLGGDLCFIVTTPSGEIKRACVVWFIQDWSDDFNIDKQIKRCGKALENQINDNRRFDDLDLPIDGLLFVNSPRNKVEVDQESFDDNKAQVVYLQIPTDIHAHADDVFYGVELLFEALTKDFS